MAKHIKAETTNLYVEILKTKEKLVRMQRTKERLARILYIALFIATYLFNIDFGFILY